MKKTLGREIKKTISSYKMETKDRNSIFICPKCRKPVLQINLKYHLWKRHGIRENKATDLSDSQRVDNLKNQHYRILLRASYIWNNQFLNDDLAKSREEILEELFLIASIYPANSPENKYLEKIIQTLVKKPTLQEYRNTCDKIFITWDNIEFLNTKIKINHKDYFSIKPIQIVGSKESLNLIKLEYFKRVYHNQVYKLYLLNNEIKEAVSDDLKKIKAVIEIQLEEIHKKKGKETRINEKVFPKNASQSVILDIISSLPENKFKFIKSAAKFLNENDQVLAFDENNNTNTEEALIFIYKRTRFNLVLWENMNDKRGAYLFKYSLQNFNQEISKLVALLKGSTHNKREKFFRNEDNFNLDYKSKLFLNHEDLLRYRWQLKTTLVNR